MTKKQFDAKFKIISRDFMRDVRRKASDLFTSGGVDVSQFDDDFSLAKIILGPAARDAAAGYRPLSPVNRSIVKNLEKF